MRYSTVFKFIAVILCAASLMGSIACGAGLVALTELGGIDAQESYWKRLENTAEGFASAAVYQYASRELGDTPQNLLNLRYGNDWQKHYFDWTKVGYVLYDGDGNVLQEQAIAGGQKMHTEFLLPANGEYMRVISVSPRQDSTSQETGEATIQVMVMPSQRITQIGALVAEYSDGHREEWDSEEVLGELMQMDGGGLMLESRNIDGIPEGDGWYVTHIVLSDMGGNVVYEAFGEPALFQGVAQDGALMQWWLPTGTAAFAAVSGTTVTEGEYTAYDAIPKHGVTVSSASVTYANAQGETLGSEGISSPDLIGTVFHDAEGNAQFRSKDPMTMDIPQGCIITYVIFVDAAENLIFEASSPAGVGVLENDEKGYLLFRGRMPGTGNTEETMPEESSVPAMDGIAATVQQDTVIYSMPSLNGEELGTLAAGEEILILEECLSVGADSLHWGLTDRGWILMNHVELVESAAAAREDVPDSAGEDAVLEDSLNTEETTALESVATEKTLPAPIMDSSTGSEKNVQQMVYYDDAGMREMVAEYVMEPIPDGWSIQIQLAEGALPYELAWTLLELAEMMHSHLLKLLGICVCVLALCVVYLCCTAARKRGSDVVRAGGLNRIPLELHFFLSAAAVAGMGLLAVEGGEYLARNNRQLAIILLAALSMGICLTVVGFFFALVAQIKTPNGYWWRNSLCGRTLFLATGFVKFCWNRGIPATCRVFRWVGSVLKRLLRAVKKILLWMWDAVRRIICWLWAGLISKWKWVTRRMARLFGLLPVTWQFLATGFLLVFLLYIMMRTYKVGYLLLGFGIFFAVILYAASAFAILLESAKRMSKGDLDTKVDDRMLIGGFREFAWELNELAGVAVLAAQKQLKSERMKTELITNVSHDIKTPLTSIINYVDLLQKPHTEQQRNQYLEVLERQSQRLKKLVEDLMEMSKASTGNMAVEIQRVDAVEAVNQALGEFTDKLERASLVPVFRKSEGPVCMMADGRLVWRIMSNLLGNAVKYALPGTRIYLDLMEVEDKVILSMKNISREELNVNADELLERFVRGDASRNTEGSGLGLNITQSLMELQKGQLQIHVDGDLFKVTLIFPKA